MPRQRPRSRDRDGRPISDADRLLFELLGGEPSKANRAVTRHGGRPVDSDDVTEDVDVEMESRWEDGIRALEDGPG